MNFNSRLKREIRRAEEFDTAGLGIISYYLRLYIVEILLSRDERTSEETEIASQILDMIENFKKSINELPDDTREKETLLTLVTDDAKAKTYVTNFAMTLYNQQLTRIQSGPWDQDLIGALWCCIDLFNCILHLWSRRDTKTTEALEKRIKYCKVYISKIIKGEIGQGKEDDEQLEQTEGGEELEEQTQEPDEDKGEATENKYENIGITTESETVQDNELDNTSNNEQANDTDNEQNKDTDNASLVSHKSGTTTDSVTNLQDDITKMNLNDTEPAREESASLNEPEFIDSDNEVSVPPNQQTRYSTCELTGMMDRSDRIEKAQKCAKYAISALNYEDIATARDELTKAMDLLNTLF
ncbi:hypothetical protein C6P45_000637 [Maudiozyma exigua]|uniref:Vta1 C-terminal domain-containing protein n=1 Tax=Maudiozyma exigua TaxID=34358 RepID=A0A9P7B8A9_MAUEX|nr:hypothetical protein C6P45_000637 [Kazachstania exigua]